MLYEGPFAGYFPRLFAYLLSASGDEDAARQLAVAAFCEALLSESPGRDDFEVTLFREARELAHRAARLSHRDGLSAREREIISLIFDAQLDRDHAARVMGLRPESVSATLAQGLRKMQSRLAAAAAA